jgi:hypothetical protein
MGVSVESEAVRLRTGYFVALVLLINLVQDGLPKIGSDVAVQVMLLPITLMFLYCSYQFLRVEPSGGGWVARLGGTDVGLLVVFLLELGFVGLFFDETRHYAAFGYHLVPVPTFVAFSVCLAGLGIATYRGSRPVGVLLASLGTYLVGQGLSIVSFPLNYLRSDMLAVIFWSDRALLAGQDPYQHFQVAERIYDFPYLPGMLLAYLPAEALHVDLRWASMFYVVVGMGLIYLVAGRAYKMQGAGLVGLFVLGPYLQYRHELYTQGHFLSLIVIFVLMQRRWFGWSALAFGVSMAMSQFSWVIFPFFLMNGLRRGGWKEVGRMGLLAAVGVGVVMVPFHHTGTGRIAHNAVGQWDALQRAIARPINLAFWVTNVVRPVNLKWIQLALLSGIFGFCWLRGRCRDLADTLRWMVAAWVVFILLNVLIDGYFYLMLLVPMMVYVCVANGWWDAPKGELA